MPTSPVSPVGPVSPVLPVLPVRPVGPVSDPVTQTIACNQCNGGFPIGNLFPGNSCPNGWTSDIDPCNTRLSPVDPILQPADPIPTMQVACYDCNAGTPVGNLFDVDATNPVCPSGWTSDPNPCATPLVDEAIPGCTDPNSITYNPLANFENGTCEYLSVEPISYPPVEEPNAGITPEGGLYENICYACSDGKIEATVIPSEVPDMCPEGFSQDSEGACPKEEIKEEKDNKNLILYLAIGIGAYMLLSKK